jgi:hypothetical protein
MASVKVVSDLIDQVQRLANRVDTGWRTRCLDAINRALQDFAHHAPWDGLKRLEQFTAPGGRYVTFPERVKKVIRVHDITNKETLNPGGNWGRRMDGTWLEQSGSQPLEWRQMGTVPVISTPATDTLLQVNTTASDNFDVVIRGLARDTAASGSPLEFYPVVETISITGTGATNTANTFVQIDEINKAKNTNGDLIVSDVVSGKQIARIEKWNGIAAYNRVEVTDPPPVGHQLLIEFFTAPRPIEAETEPLDPSLDTQYIMWKAAGDIMWQKQEAQPAQVAWAKADEILDSVRARETAFGERDSQSRPTLSYYDLEE